MGRNSPCRNKSAVTGIPAAQPTRRRMSSQPLAANRLWLGKRLAGRRIDRLSQPAFEFARLFEMKCSEVPVSGGRLELRNGRRDLVDARRVPASRLFQIGEILALDPFIFRMMLAHRFRLLGRSPHLPAALQPRSQSD